MNARASHCESDLSSSWESRRSSPNIEEMTKRSELEAEPCPLDILCGRGRGYFDHPGNRRMLSIVNDFKDQYKTASKVSKSMITAHVLKRIQEVAGNTSPKFLKPVGGEKGGPWYELTEKEAHQKIAHTLREQKKIVKASSGAIKASKARGKSSTSKPKAAPGVTATERSALPEPRPAARPTTFNSSSSASTVSDDDEELSQRQAYRNKDNESNSESSSDGEPLSFKQEPLFVEADIEMMHTVLDDEAEDPKDLLGSFLEDLEL